MRYRLSIVFALSVLLAAGAASGDARARAWDALRSRVVEVKYLDHSRPVYAVPGATTPTSGRSPVCCMTSILARPPAISPGTA
jgi:hypothetical protein